MVQNVTATTPHGSPFMAYYLLTAFAIGGALGVLHWVILGS